MTQLLTPTQTAQHLNGDTWSHLLAHLQRGGAYGYWWTLDEIKTFTIKRGPRAGQQEKCKRTYWWPSAKPLPIPSGETEHVYFGVHPAIGIPQERTSRDGPYIPKPEYTRPLVGEIAAVNCLFAEFDAKDFAEGKPGARNHIDGLALKPSVLIDSGGGYHAYWLLGEPLIVNDDTRATARDLQNRWVQFIEADEGSKDLARVLRVPGRRNVKSHYGPDFPMVAFVFADFDRLYAAEDLVAAIPPEITATEARELSPFTPTAGDHSAYVQAAYDGEIAAVLAALPGQKHRTLRNAAIKLASLLWTNQISEQQIADGLQDAAERNGCDVGYEHRTIRDGIAYGSARPRTIPERQQPAARAATASDGAQAADRPTIDISTIDLPTVMPQAWDAISAANDPPVLFRRAGELARLETTEQGALLIRTVDTRRMAGILARAARWVRVSYGKRGDATEKETIPPAAVVDDAMVNVDPRIPALTRIIHAPTFAEGDLLLAEPGYHAAARIYYDPKHGAVVPPVPAEPTAADLEKAKALVLGELLVDFPFVSDADRAHAVALFLLPFVRELISGPTPLHLIEAPTMGTGKGLLAETMLLPALGETPTVMTEASTDEEWGKVITSNLLMAPAAIYIDNLNHMLASGKLAAALTAREYSDRVLGSSEQVSLPVRCVWVATANNPTLSTEISRRCIRIRIDPRVDEPWKREGFKHPKLRSWVESNRGQLIWAALVMCRYGLRHGAAGPALGSYEAWSDVMGRILAGAGIPGFLGNLDMLYARADAEGAAWRALIAAWWEQHQATPKAAGDLFPLVAEVEADTLINGRDEVGRKKSFGKALARVLERVFTVETTSGPLRLQVAEDGVRHKAKLWKLAPVEGGGIGSLGGLFQPHARTKNFLDARAIENPHNPHNPPILPEGAEGRDIGQVDPYGVIEWLEDPPRYTVVEHTDAGDIDLPGDYSTLEEAQAAMPDSAYRDIGRMNRARPRVQTPVATAEDLLGYEPEEYEEP